MQIDLAPAFVARNREGSDQSCGLCFAGIFMQDDLGPASFIHVDMRRARKLVIAALAVDKLKRARLVAIDLMLEVSLALAWLPLRCCVSLVV